MASRDDYIYCPFAYGYSNYARRGYARIQLQFGDLVQIGSMDLDAQPWAALAGRSARCAHKQAALNYARFVTSSECQRSLYAYSGGQPAHRSAWTDKALNHHCRDFFRGPLAAVERAYVRPRYDGYISFQDKAGVLLHESLRREEDSRTSIERLQRLYEQRTEQS